VELNHPHRVVVAGDLDMATIPLLLERSINLPPDDLVIDCTRVEFMDAAALNGFVALNAALSRRGHHLRLNGLRPPTRRLFGLGDAPELHTWVMQQDAVDTEILERATAESGAVVMGRRLFDVVNAPDGWNEDMGYGADQTGTPPFFVVTHSPPRDVRLERELGMRFTFVSDLVTAIDQARSAATHGDVVIMGGGDVIGQALEQGLVDELRLHLAPMVLG